MRATGLIHQIRNRLKARDTYTRPEYWDAKASEYSGRAISMWANPNLNQLYDREQKAMLDRYLPAKMEGLECLDAGCGMGRMSLHLAGKGAKVTAVDFSAQTIEAARQQSAHPNIDYRVGSLFELEAEDAYDAVFVWGVLTVACVDAKEVADVMGRLHRALRPGGHFFIMEPLHSMKGLIRVLDLDLGQFCEVMATQGWSIQTIQQLHFWPARLALAYTEVPGAVTSAVYHMGQRAMVALGSEGWGDYKFIHARPS